MVDVVEDAMVVGGDHGTKEGVPMVVEDGAVQVDSIPWLATSVGWVAIWPVIVPPLVARQQVVAILAPLKEVH